MKVSRWAGGLVWVCLPGLLFVWSCRRETPSTFDRNLAPETYISLAPAESSLAYYRAHIYWNGEDPDGLVSYFEYAVTDSNEIPGQNTPGFAGYYRTSSTDSLFALKADSPQILGHRFYVRAVDNEGKVDPTPAWTYFIAHNYNFPGVRFKTSTGRWLDRDGNERTITIRSNNRFTATDTIGIGGSIAFTWDGFEEDEGGYVVGFRYRSSSDLVFRGGTLADTSYSRTFEPTLVGGKLRYFSGGELLQVRAMDDAGAETQPDSIRSVVVNFNPVTWIVDPREPTPVHARLFIERRTAAVYPSGTTLADGGIQGRGIEFTFVGFDDHRDLKLNPASEYDISAFSYRKLLDGGGTAFDSLGVGFTEWDPFPAINKFGVGKTQNLTSGDHMFLLRCRDQLGRWGAPDTVVVRVNYFPYYTSVTYVDGLGVEQQLWVPPSGSGTPDTVSVSLAKGEDGNYPDLEVRFLALDVHKTPPETHPQDFNTVVEEELSYVEEYRARLNGAPAGFEVAVPRDAAGVRRFPVSAAGGSGVIRPGLNSLDLAARDAGGRVTSLTFVFRVTLEQ